MPILLSNRVYYSAAEFEAERERVEKQRDALAAALTNANKAIESIAAERDALRERNAQLVGAIEAALEDGCVAGTAQTYLRTALEFFVKTEIMVDNSTTPCHNPNIAP